MTDHLIIPLLGILSFDNDYMERMYSYFVSLVPIPNELFLSNKKVGSKGFQLFIWGREFGHIHNVTSISEYSVKRLMSWNKSKFDRYFEFNPESNQWTSSGLVPLGV